MRGILWPAKAVPDLSEPPAPPEDLSAQLGALYNFQAMQNIAGQANSLAQLQGMQNGQSQNLSAGPFYSAFGGLGILGGLFN